MSKYLSLSLLFFAGCLSNTEVPNNPTGYFQAYDYKWDDPTINPIFDTEWEAKEYAHRNNMGSIVSGDDSHSYIVRRINYRYEIRQVNDSTDEVLHTTNSKEDGESYVEQYTSSHSDLFMYDLKKGIIITTSTP
tara:strand:+ start:915 stop:1316 length:402 start_codon:yes stop_codon:yes gene_type:complete